MITILSKKSLYLFIAATLSITSIGISYITSVQKVDFFHWGIIYSASMDIINGLSPFKQTYDIYGFGTTLIQAFGLMVFPASVMSVGITTGIFYSAGFIVSFLIWRKVFGGGIATISLIIAYFAQPSIGYPWPNYIANLFNMLAILCLVYNPKTNRTIVLAGFFSSLAIICRYSFALSSLPPVIFYGFFCLWSRRCSKKTAYNNSIKFLIGFSPVILIFTGYIIFTGKSHDFWILNYKVSGYLLEHIKSWPGTPSSILGFSGQLITKMFFSIETPLFVYTLVAWSCLSYIIYTAYSALSKKGLTYSAASHNRILIAVSSLCGFINCLHLYESFRLASSAVVLGIGILIFEIKIISKRFPPKVSNWCIAIIVLSFTLYHYERLRNISPFVLSKITDFDYQRTTSIEAIRGLQLDDISYNHFKRQVKVLQMSKSCDIKYLVNLTNNSRSKNTLTLYLVKDYMKVQRQFTRIPFHKSDILFPDESAKINELISKQKTLIISENNHSVPESYGFISGYYDTNIYVPKKCASVLQNLGLGGTRE